MPADEEPHLGPGHRTLHQVQAALRSALDTVPAGTLSSGLRRRIEHTVHRELVSALTGEDRVGIGPDLDQLY